MGLYDRDYVRDDEPSGFSLGGGGHSMTTKLIAINAIVFAVDFFFLNGRPLNDFGALHSDMWRRPWEAYQLLTCGFLHADLMHIVFNMIGLWTFGRMVEMRYGAAEFLRFYLASVLVSGAAWMLVHVVTGRPASLIGASGAVNAACILFALNYPRMQLLLFGAIPMKAWTLAMLFVGLDVLGAVNRGQRDNVAYEAHLAGAAFAWVYFRAGLNFGRLPLGWFKRLFRSRPKLRVFGSSAPRDLDSEVDAILKKIKEQGEDSLTRAERKTLEEASRRYQQQRRQ